VLESLTISKKHAFLSLNDALWTRIGFVLSLKDCLDFTEVGGLSENSAVLEK